MILSGATMIGKIWIFGLILGFALLLSISPASSDVYKGTLPEWGQDMLDAHNWCRDNVTDPTAANMKKMVWNWTLQKTAQNYADKCKWAHNPKRQNEYKALGGTLGYIGENMAMSTPPMDSFKVVQAFLKKKAFFNFHAFTCQTGKNCGHYIQLAWADSKYLGCGFKRCVNNIVAGRTVGLWVCNYAPGGYLPNQRPYIAGKPCSRCGPGETCESNLCVESTSTTVPTPPRLYCGNTVRMGYNVAGGKTLPTGTFVTNQWSNNGFTVECWNCGSGRVMIFDADKPTGGQSQLKTPGTGANNSKKLSNVLIVSADNNAANPKARASGGGIVMKFNNGKAKVTEIVVINLTKTGNLIRFYNSNKQLTKTTPITPLGRNSVQTITVSETNVGYLEIFFVEVAALAQVTFQDCGLTEAPGHKDDETCEGEECSGGGKLTTPAVIGIAVAGAFVAISGLILGLAVYRRRHIARESGGSIAGSFANIFDSSHGKVIPSASLGSNSIADEHENKGTTSGEEPREGKATRSAASLAQHHDSATAGPSSM